MMFCVLTLGISGRARRRPPHAVVGWRIAGCNLVRHHKNERARVHPPRPLALHDPREPSAPRKMYRCLDSKKPHRQTCEQVGRLTGCVPAGTPVTSAAATSPLPKPKEAATIQQADRDPPTRNADHLANGSPLPLDETQCRDRHDEVEACSFIRQGTCVGDLVGRFAGTLATRIRYPFRIDIDAGDRASCRGSEGTREEARAAADIEKRFPWTRSQLSKEQRQLALSDPPTPRRLIPPVVGLCVGHVSQGT